MLLFFWQQGKAQSLGDPVVKITFGSGTASRGGALAADSGSTTYVYSGSGQIGENYYTITNQVNTTVHGGFLTSYDHDYETTGRTDGYMMVVNGNITAGTVYTRNVDGLCGNTQYQFGVWIKNVLSTGGILPNMVFHIYAADGTTELGSGVSTGDVPTGNVWHNYTANFTLPAGTSSVVIKLVSNASGTQGNDFAVDDITFSPYGSTVSAVFNKTAGTTTETTCAGSKQTYTVDATSTLASGYVQKLQIYSNGVWSDLSSGTTQTSYTITAPTNAGTYQYRLVSALSDNISSSSCVVASNNLTLTVTPSPIAAFTPPGTTCLGAVTSFTNGSNANGSTLTAWSWNFGDPNSGVNNTSALQNPTHTFTAAGDYTVTLTLPATTGCAASSVSHVVHISALPVARFTPSSPNCLGNAVTFTDGSTAGEETITSWSWNFGETASGTNTSAIQNPTHTYAAAGTYTVTLTVTNSNGCTATISTPVMVSPLPQANFTVPEICLSDGTATFINTSTLSGDASASLTYLWNFGDAGSASNTSTAKNGMHLYTKAGTYTVTLTVTSQGGCFNTAIKQFTVNGINPVAGFTVAKVNQLCSDQMVNFTDNSSVTDFGNVTKIQWYFDYDNNPTTVETYTDPTPGKTYTHTYPSFGTPTTKNYHVRLVAYSGGTCVSVPYDKTITLLAVPTLSFPAVKAVCLNAGNVQLAASETSGVAGTGKYSGDGVSSTGLFNPVTAGAGTHIISYVYTPTNGCAETATQTIIVNPVPKLIMGVDFTVLSGGSAAMPAAASGDGLTYLWSPATYLSSTTELNPTVIPQADVTYTLIVTNSEGCSVSGQISVSVLQSPVIPNTFTPNGDGYNDLWNIKYLDTYTDCTVEIFNRYGTKIYYSIGYAVPWDGTYNGSPVPLGTYYYIINPKHGRKVLSGYVTVVR